ncbi:MAG: transketolase, partial [Alphaproteobacteria bacterium]|nr:transketolase [Alphaproteobacteria bacterium]
MNQPVIYVFTHDSIALGEDGVTHQPIEQLASLRLIPNLHVMRPANAIEVAMSMELALRRKDGPTAIVLSRQDFPIVPDGAAPDEMEKGGYILRDAVSKKPTITLMATGSEVALALAVQKTLYSRGVSAAVVSMPAPEIFRLQSDEYRRKILRGRVIVIEAGTTRAWHEFADEVIGVDTFGAGGKGADVYKYFGFDATIIAKKIEAKLKPTK